MGETPGLPRTLVRNAGVERGIGIDRLLSSDGVGSADWSGNDPMGGCGTREEVRFRVQGVPEDHSRCNTASLALNQAGSVGDD
jgi:hypothetical protein